MDSYKLLLTLHVVAVVVGIGATFAFPFIQGFGERKGVAATRFAMELSERIEKYLVIPLAVLLFVFGLGLIFDDKTGYSSDMPVWLTVAITLFLLSFATAVFVQSRFHKQALAALAGVADGPDLPAAYVPVGKKIQMVGGTLALATIVITVLMVWKPGS